MNANSPLLTSQRVMQACLYLMAAIGLFGGALRMYLGERDATARRDNVHRFMDGVYFATGIINLWAAVTIRQQVTLVILLALGVFKAGVGRLIAISQVGMPQPTIVWLGYLIPELGLPIVIPLAQLTTRRDAVRAGGN